MTLTSTLAPTVISQTALFCRTKLGLKQLLGHITEKLLQAKHKLIVSNNAFDHEISGSNYYLER